MKAKDCRLYLITPPSFEANSFAVVLEAALAAGDVAALQLRLKGADDETICRAANVLRPLAQKRGVAFILNDRPDLAVELACDGVHIGQEDAAYEEARRLMGSSGIIGVTCHDSRHLAMEAAEKGSDYVAFGAFFPTRTKSQKARAAPEILEMWSETTMVPAVAIGGITVENCPVLVKAGADFLAVSKGVWEFKDGPSAAVKAFNEVIAKAG